ncbi:uncharacterized protein LOC113322827 [Papaver somniferum]|nr:uncharacterized protein LOC113322827 [Papaver somniferum]XP_026426773.1 uncharacterized protein LOC113322827 [Papaver somniferum]
MLVTWEMLVRMGRMIWLGLCYWISSCLTVADEIARSIRSGDIGPFHAG